MLILSVNPLYLYNSAQLYHWLTPVTKQLASFLENSGVDVYKKKRDRAWFRSRAGITPADLLCCYRCFSRAVLLSQNTAITTGGFYFHKLMANRTELLLWCPRNQNKALKKTKCFSVK